MLFGPGKAANAGGVATSRARDAAERRPATRGPSTTRRPGWPRSWRGIHERCAAAADDYGRPGDYVLGANIAGFVRVADAMLAMGVV